MNFLFIYIIDNTTITEKSKQEKSKTVLTIAKRDGNPVNTINNLKTKLIRKKRIYQKSSMTIPHKKVGNIHLLQPNNKTHHQSF